MREEGSQGDVCLECECPIEATVEQRLGEGLRSCTCTTAELRVVLGRAYTFASKQGEEIESLKRSLYQENYRIVSLEEQLNTANRIVAAVRHALIEEASK